MTMLNKPKFTALIESGNSKSNGESFYAFGKYGFVKEEFEILDNNASKKYHKPKGKYTLLTLKEILYCNKETLKYYKKQLIETLNNYLKDITIDDTILIVGLGNRHISADSLGTEVVKNITVTRNLIDDTPKVCAIAPSVMGLTGIESSDTISGVIGKINPSYIIMIDTLCAGDVSRLGVSFQFSNTPITPGSGIKNSRKKLKTSVKTISIGVPLVVYSSTFIKSALENAQIYLKDIKDKILKEKISNLYNNEFNELVTLNEIEYTVKLIGKFIAEAINEVILSGYNVFEIN